MDCFICSGSSNPHTGQGIFIEGACAKFTGQDISSAINHLVGDAFSVVIDENDTLCNNCTGLVRELDRYRYESSVLEEILQRQINRKYKLGDFSKVLLSIDTVALLSFYVRPNGQNECKECGQIVQHLDEIAAHYKYHQLYLDKTNSFKLSPKEDGFNEVDPVYLECYDITKDGSSNSVCDSKIQLDSECKPMDLEMFEEKYDFEGYSNIIIDEELHGSASLVEVLPDDVFVLKQDYLSAEKDVIYNDKIVDAKPAASQQQPARSFKYKCTECSYVSILNNTIYLYLLVSK